MRANAQCTTKQVPLKKILTLVSKMRISSASLGMQDLEVEEEDSKMSTRKTFSRFSRKCSEEVWEVEENEDEDVILTKLRIIRKISY